jgi:hypothetical protein
MRDGYTERWKGGKGFSRNGVTTKLACAIGDTMERVSEDDIFFARN